VRNAPNIRPIEDSDRYWVRHLLEERWGSSRVVTLGTIHDAAALPAIVALLGQKRVGLLTYSIDKRSCEVVSLNSLVSNAGVGTQLLQSLQLIASDKGCDRVWLCTTNDNTHALKFYQKRGFTIARVNVDVIAEYRKIKPEIPESGEDDIPIRDEIVLEKKLTWQAEVESK